MKLIVPTNVFRLIYENLSNFMYEKPINNSIFRSNQSRAGQCKFIYLFTCRSHVTIISRELTAHKMFGAA